MIYPVIVDQRPAWTISNGQKYVVAGKWIPVPMDTDYHNIHLYAKYVPYKSQLEIGTYRVRSKTSGSTYRVSARYAMLGSKTIIVSCDCQAGKYRGKCKHGDAVKRKLMKPAA